MSCADEAGGDFYQRMQRKAEEHLAACNDALLEEIDGAMTFPDTPAIGPYCGCDTCVVREVLQVVWEDMLIEARREAIRAVNS